MTDPIEPTPPELAETNPYSAPLLQTEIVDESDGLDLESPSTPRWWTSFAICGLSLVCFLFASGVMFLAAIFVVHGSINAETLGDENMLTSVMGSRIGLFLMIVVPQGALVIPAIVAAFLSPVETRCRLGLVRGHWPIWTWAAAAMATPLVGTISAIFVSMFMSESETLKELSSVFRDHGESGFMIPLALMIGLTPAICEELLFRGYMQTRLTKSLGPIAGLLVASTLFALFHMDIVHVVAVMPLGLFLGWVTLQSGSLFPAMLGHFVNNSLSVVLAVHAPEDEASMLATPALALMAAILAFGATGFAAVCYASVTYRQSETTQIT